jgi:hypothetical protein
VPAERSGSRVVPGGLMGPGELVRNGGSDAGVSNQSWVLPRTRWCEQRDDAAAAEKSSISLLDVASA